MKKYVAGSFVIFFLFIFCIPFQASALTIDPALKKIYVKPGDQIIETITLVNEQKEKITVYPLVENFKPKDAYGTPEFLGDTDPEGAARWIQIPFKRIELKPHSKHEALFKINIPLWTRPGGHYAALFWSDAQAEKEGRIGAVSRIGSLFLFDVAGKISGTVAANEFKPIVSQGSVHGFRITFRNRSTVHVVPRGTIEIYTAWGKKIDTIIVNPLGLNALAESDRTFLNEWKLPLFSVLPFRAHLHISFDGVFPAVDKDISFYNAPVAKIIKIIIGVVLIILIAGWRLYRKKIRGMHHLITSHE